MFELDKYDAGLHKYAPARPVSAYEPVRDVVAMSFLHWGEHCVECAAPECYSSCDLYQPRSDFRCRRFVFGAYKNRAFPSLRGYGVEVGFKKWAKLETLGNLATFPVKSTLRFERVIEAAAPLVNFAGRTISRMSGERSWAELSYEAAERIERRIIRSLERQPRPEAFLLEVYNPGDAPIRMQLVFSISVPEAIRAGREPRPIAPIVNTLSLSPGYSRHEFPVSSFERIFDQEMPFKITILPEGDTYPHLVFLTADLVVFGAADRPRPSDHKLKCIAWDLDDTLWTGTLVETDEVTLRPGIVELLKSLDERGILLSVVSKNNFDRAWSKLKSLQVADYFLYPQIDWLPKSRQIGRLARQLKLGLESIALVDNDSFELDEVSRAFPEVACINADQIGALSSDPRFEGAVTAESRRRRRYYQEQNVREADEDAFADGHLEFLAACEIVLEIAPYAEAQAERIAELVQRTNQLNFSGRKYSRAELEQLISDAALHKFVLKCSDRYGSNGTIGFCAIRNPPGTLEVVDLMLSCRVQGRFIEQAFLDHLYQHHNSDRAQSIWVNLAKTAGNSPAGDVLRALGFRPARTAGDQPDAGVILHSPTTLHCEFIKVVCSAGHCLS
jgi:FkbH-like protein